MLGSPIIIEVKDPVVLGEYAEIESPYTPRPPAAGFGSVVRLHVSRHPPPAPKIAPFTQDRFYLVNLSIPGEAVWGRGFLFQGRFGIKCYPDFLADELKRF
jgi:hypothetical protein